MRALRNIGLVLTLMLSSVACQQGGQTPLKEIQRARSGALNIVLLSAAESLRQGKDAFVLEFRTADGQLVDAGTVSVTATMAMAGMSPMFGDLAVKPTDTKGRYEVTSDLGMAGSWRVTVMWNGPAGQGSTSLATTAS